MRKYIPMLSLAALTLVAAPPPPQPEPEPEPDTDPVLPPMSRQVRRALARKGRK